MNKQTKSTYQRFRKLGMSAKHSLSSAKTVVEFNQRSWDETFTNLGDVRIRAKEERESYFSVYGEPEGYTDIYGKVHSIEEEKQEIVNQINTFGCWIVFSEVFDGNDWVLVDSIGMCIYNDTTSPFENWYVVGLMDSAIKESDELLRIQSNRERVFAENQKYREQGVSYV